MNHTKTLFATCLTSLITVTSVFGQAKPATAPASAPLPASSVAAVKVAVVDIGKVIETYHKTKESQKTLEAAFNTYAGERKAQEDELRKIQEDGKKLETEVASTSLSEAAKNEKKKVMQDKLVEFNNKRQALMDFVQQRERQLSEQNTKHRESLITEVFDVAEKKSKELGYNLVLAKSKGGPIIYNEPSFDITQAVIDGLNAGAKK
ncbi:MAG: OmpH family outer membrane protein [Verrucomicrobiota bacterium]|nr:OmpH family outer membrane protein [Verrucomicrobiota bacterium]